MNNNNSNNNWSGMLVLSILGIIGFLALYFTGCFNITAIDELYKYIYDNGAVAIFSLFFIVITLYCWIVYFLNFVLKPKKKVLYLLNIEDNMLIFIDKKGKTFLFSDCGLDVGKYYYVLKTHNIIKEILGESLETFIVPREKKSYWLNFYSPVGNFENIILLPIVYVILLPGILSVIMSDGYQKLYGVIYSIVPCYVIIYDFVYKIKLKNEGKERIDDSKFVNSYYLFINIIKIILVVVINIVLIYTYINSYDYISKLFLLPFCLCALCSLGYLISKILNNSKLINFFVKGYVVIFLLFLFGFLIFFYSKIN